MSNNIYNILSNLNALTPKEEPVAQAKSIYESVEARGSVLAGVKSVQAKLEAKLAEHKQDMAEGESFVSDSVWRMAKQIAQRNGKNVEDFGPEEVDSIADQVGLPSSDVADILELSQGIAEVAPEGWEGTVKAMKTHKDIDNPWALAHSMKNKGYKSHVKESTMGISKALLESVNFRKMMDEADMTADEMLEAINSDIQAYKASGDMTARLRDFMHLHNHMKKMEEAAVDPMAPQMPSGQDILPTKKPGLVSRAVDALKGPNDEQLLAKLRQDSHTPTVDEELNELAKLAGISDECIDGELSADGAVMKFDGEEEPEDGIIDVVTVAETKKTSLSDIARLSGIFQEGKDYGDTSYNEPPTYDNTPDECVQGVEVQTQGGDGEVAGKEKAMKNNKPTFKNGDNPLSETKDMMRPAAEFNYVKEMGRDLMKAYQGIKTK